MTRKALAEKKETLPAYLKGMDGVEDAGLENADKDSYAIPFLKILQSSSPQVKKTDGRYIQGAEEGTLLNTVTQEVIDPKKEQLYLIPVYYRRAFMEWTVNAGGSGDYVQEHSPTTPLQNNTERDDKNRDILPNGNQLADSRYHYVLLIRADGSYEPAVIAMQSTQIKKSKRLISDIDMKRKSKGVPMPALMYHVGVEGESKEENSWWGWLLKFGHLVPEQPLFDAAMAFQGQIRAGEVKEATDTLNEGTSNAVDDDENLPY